MSETIGQPTETKMDWNDYQTCNTWALQVGTRVKLKSMIFTAPEYGGQEGIVKRPITRRNQIRVVVEFAFNGKSVRIPLEWIVGYASPTNDSVETVTKNIPQPSKISRGDFFAEVGVGDWVLFDRGGKKFDVVRFDERKQTRVYCFDPKRGKRYGYDPSWYVCKVDAQGRL